MKQIDYGKLYPGLVMGSTCMDPLGMIIRSTEAGISHIFDPNIASHAFIICMEHDLFYAMEMAPPKIREADLTEHLHSNFGDHIVFAASYIKWDDYDTQKKANDWLLASHTKGIKYDIEELFKFWDDKIKDDPNKIVCSDLVRNMFRFIKIDYPKKWDDLCSPYDIQKYSTETGKIIQWWK